VPDDDWQRAVDLQLKHCSGIILCPWHTPGVLEESRRTAFDGDLLKQTVWFMPPARSGLKLADEWEKTSTAAATFGITSSPEYSPQGASFNIAADRQPIEGAIANQEELGECIKAMLESSTAVRIEVVQANLILSRPDCGCKLLVRLSKRLKKARTSPLGENGAVRSSRQFVEVMLLGQQGAAL
jgi:hypothetical protein